MKLMQQESQFTPVAIVLETREEVDALRSMVMCGRCTDIEHEIAIKIASFLANEAKL